MDPSVIPVTLVQQVVYSPSGLADHGTGRVGPFHPDLEPSYDRLGLARITALKDLIAGG